MAYGFNTRAIHAGQPNDPGTGSVTFPIYQTSTYGQEEPGVHKGFCYSRTDNPSRRALEENLAAIEGAQYGLAFASGMAAINTVLNTLKAGDHVVTCRDLYGGAYRIFTKLYSKFGVQFTFVDATNLEDVEAAFRPATKLLWLETPSNPLLFVTDIAACGKIARRKGALTVVDNTFATPVLQRPLTLGADIVVHSTTKYINGHSDVLGGALLTDSKELYENLKFFQNAVGAVPGPQDCFLVLRGTKTLALRMERHCANTRAVARWLAEHDKIAKVYYPGLPNHPQHELARRQMKDFGAMVSFELKASADEAKRFTSHVKLWTLAESLGGVKSLLCHPPTMTHASVEPDVRRRVGIADGLIRLSVGLEDAEDLIADLDQALARVRVGESEKVGC
ncbi:MAG: cystathionine gamma-synthase [Planctomycetes bacterium]|nr:cystathionine gamma-synthase [Planctomycetota bacterium]